MPPSLPFEDAMRAVFSGREKASFAWPADVFGAADGKVAAAVLLMLFERREEPWIVLTRRTDRVRHHKGEISFPGGARDPHDPDLAATALREAHEELGIDPREIRIVGELDDLPTYATNYVVSPFVACISSNHSWVPNDHEIAEVIELPLPELARVARTEQWTHDGHVFPMHIYEVGEYVVWGATGRILHQLIEAAGPAIGDRHGHAV